MKVLLNTLVVAAATCATPVWAFNTLTCHGTIDVRLTGPSSKKTGQIAPVQSFSITRQQALEMELSVEGVQVGRIFPWDHVVWQEAKSLAGFKNVKFKTDDATLITVSLYDIARKKGHTMACHFSFE